MTSGRRSAPLVPFVASVAGLLAAVSCPAPLLAVGGAAELGGPACGNGAIEPGEDCDDGARFDLDGCNRDCRYEQVQRLSALELRSSAAPGFCVPATNQLGGAFSASLGLPVLNQTIQNGIADEVVVWLFDFLELDDPLGLNDASLEMGVLSAVAGSPPTPPALDKSYLVAGEELGADGLPSQQVAPGSITTSDLAAGPSDFDASFFGSRLEVLGARFAATVGVATSLPAPPPGALAAGFLAFEELDGSGGAEGLCGNLTVGSLATIPLPNQLTVGGQACRANCSNSRAYVDCQGGPVTDSCHSLLDVLVGGCRVTDLCLPAISATQPDVGAGVNPPHVLSFALTGGGIEKVTVIEPDDAYSSWFSFETQRAHAILDVLFRDGFESGDTAGWSSAVP